MRPNRSQASGGIWWICNFRWGQVSFATRCTNSRFAHEGSIALAEVSINLDESSIALAEAGMGDVDGVNGGGRSLASQGESCVLALLGR
eukprot:CAMPEP_0198232378 /NCGR_PEP_ID=MMETSP1445-20131203/115699_1 /TAXON_ID=36898 /ORGANISM="Pyramimonas sp., Strain CCMP2087" /LENGTH=88 /DNA_ID=CAMNT_0043913049 /DNA_START=333 /DNA_END=599 /DNA_ORIENTATION=+